MRSLPQLPLLFLKTLARPSILTLGQIAVQTDFRLFARREFHILAESLGVYLALSD